MSKQSINTRSTQQRKALIEAFSQTQRALAPLELLKLALPYSPGLGIATVYRNLRSLEVDGIIKSVSLPGQPLLYELADCQHHHHFRCRECGGVFPIHGCPDTLADIIPTGFILEDHDIILYGICSNCKQSIRS